MSYAKETLTLSHPITDEGNALHHFLLKIKQKTRSKVLLHGLFALIAIIEFLFFISSLLTLTLGREAAFLLAIFFATLFSYLVLRLHFAARKQQAFDQLVKEFLGIQDTYSRVLSIEGHLAIAAHAKKASLWLKGKEYTLLTPPQLLVRCRASLPQSLSQKVPLERLSAQVSAALFWNDGLRLRELLLLHAIDAYIEAIKIAPTNRDYHSLLASTYLMWAHLYAPESNGNSTASQKHSSKTARARFHEIALLAVEEFTILNDYTPNDPWVHSQLAEIYRALHMKEAEIHEHEILLSLKPQDAHTLLVLGMLYFQIGKNAKALRLYEQLKELDVRKSEELISTYSTPRTFPNVIVDSV